MCSHPTTKPHNFGSTYAKDTKFLMKVWNIIQIKVANSRPFGPERFSDVGANDQGGPYQIGLISVTICTFVLFIIIYVLAQKRGV